MKIHSKFYAISRNGKDFYALNLYYSHHIRVTVYFNIKVEISSPAPINNIIEEIKFYESNF